MLIKYGITDNSIDVTNICLTILLKNNIITIPSGENNRTTYFTDPLYGILKKIFVIIDDKTYEYEYNYIIKINILDKTITTISDEDIDNKLKDIQSKLKIFHGNFTEELPEQRMTVRYLTGNEKVLELGSNIGRNSLIIAHIIENNNNFVTLESDIKNIKQLTENRDINNFNFHIENCALSKRMLIQKGWNTFPSNKLLEGHTLVNTITFNELQEKYNIKFDTLILDCEGAFYYILLDMPEILENINLIIVENDYDNMTKKIYVDYLLKKNNFYRDYVERGGWGWGCPCSNNFFEVWKK
jgi:FkbM family methyltransferase